MNYEFIGLLLIASCALIYFSHYLKKKRRESLNLENNQSSNRYF